LDVEAIVDLDVAPRVRIIFVGIATTLVSAGTYVPGRTVPRRARCKVNDGVDVNVAVS
jgi:hypothetical protein